MKNLLLLVAFIYSFQVFGQAKRILVYDFKTKIVDTLPIIDFDITKTSDFTPFEIGNFNNSLEFLDEFVPEMNFAKNIASVDLDLTNFPVRTSVKLFRPENDTLSSLCSGNLISRKHILSAAHCVSDFSMKTFFERNIYACPVFDNGMENPNFECSYVSKIYIFENWDAREDIALLELEKPIGDQTGWIGIGFENDDNLLKNGVFYKFSYPSYPFLQIDSTKYNGDTLNYSFGKIDILQPKRLGISDTYGIGGESGSSLIKVKNGSFYSSYGVLNFSSNMSHSRIRNWIFYALEHIIHDDLVLSNDALSVSKFEIYPIPTHDFLFVKHPSILKGDLMIFDAIGNELMILNNFDFQESIDLSSLINGIYFVNIISGKESVTKKIIKK